MLKSKPMVFLLLLALLAPMPAVASAGSQAPFHAAVAQEGEAPIENLDRGDFGGGSNPQQNFNPFSPTVLSGATTWLFEPLMIINAYSCEVIPWLATEFAWPDPQTLQFTIREGVTWSDGTPFTAEDVVFTHKLGQAFPALDTDQAWDVLTDVVAEGNTVTFTFNTPAGAQFSNLVDNPILPKHIWEAQADPVTFLNEEPVSTGPFLVESFNPQQLVMVRNPDYWQAEKVQVQRLTYTKTEAGGQVAQLALGEGRYDWADQFQPGIEETYVAKDPEHNKYWFPAGGSVSLMMNHSKAPFNDPAFRQGIAYAFDRESMAQRAAFGYTGGSTQAFLTLPNQEIYLDPSIPDQGFLPHDPAKAIEILTAGGYVMDGDSLTKDGEPVNVTFSVPASFNDWVQAAELVREGLGEIGINVEIDSKDPDLVFDERKAGNFDMTFDAPGGGCNLWAGYNYALGGSDAPTPVDTPVDFNYIRFNSPETQALIDQLQGATDIEAQTPIAHQLQQMMMTQVPFIPLWYGPVWFEYRTENAEGWPSAENPYAHPGNPLVIITNLVPPAAA
ncbi:MAG: ABC transporter substrate-binding protein [Chloroflexia bacterium]|nr:ABC transporter substrate-binding protein [Chloroflexia bacterium]